MFFIHAAWRRVLADAKGGGFAYDFAHHAARPHYADGTKPLVGHADVATGHEKVGDVAAVKAAIGRPVGAFVIVLHAMRIGGDELIALIPSLVPRIRLVQIDVPRTGKQPSSKTRLLIKPSVPRMTSPSSRRDSRLPAMKAAQPMR